MMLKQPGTHSQFSTAVIYAKWGEEVTGILYFLSDSVTIQEQDDSDAFRRDYTSKGTSYKYTREKGKWSLKEGFSWKKEC